MRVRFGDIVAVVEVKGDYGHDVCTDRTACGNPLRGGIQIRPTAGGSCTGGFTAHGSDGSRWLVTAGHCGALDSAWRHGQQYLGPIRQRLHQNQTDLARIRIDNAYWQTGGYLYAGGTTPIPIGAVVSDNYLSEGDFICRAGWVSGQYCGSVLITHDNPVLDGIQWIQLLRSDICANPGDSGGPWYEVRSPEFYAVGIHSVSTTSITCPSRESSWATHADFVDGFMPISLDTR